MVETFSKKLARFEEGSLLIMVVVTLILVVINVVLRCVFNKTLTWGEELSRFLFIAITYIGASAGVRTKGHIVVELLITQVPSTKRVLLIIANSLATLFSLIIVISSTKTALFLKMLGQTSTGLSIPMWIPYLGVIIGSLMMFYRFNEVFLNILRESDLK